MTKVYVVKSINEGYDVYKEDVLVTTDEQKALKVARKEADYTYKGSELTTWENDVLINAESFSDRTDTEIIFERVSVGYSEYFTKKIRKVVEAIDEGLSYPLIIITESYDFKEFLDDYAIQVEYTEMTFDEYNEAYGRDPETHYVICSHWDSHRLSKINNLTKE